MSKFASLSFQSNSTTEKLNFDFDRIIRHLIQKELMAFLDIKQQQYVIIVFRKSK